MADIATLIAAQAAKPTTKTPNTPKAGTGSKWRLNTAPRLQAQRFNWYSVACSPRLAGRRLVFAQFYHLAQNKPHAGKHAGQATRCYEYVFLLTKSKKYYYDWQAVAEPIAPTTAGRLKSGVSKGNKYNVTVPGQNPTAENQPPPRKGRIRRRVDFSVRSRRNVWQINNVGYHGGISQRSRRNLRKRAFWRAVPSAGLSLTPFSAAARRHGSKTA